MAKEKKRSLDTYFLIYSNKEGVHIEKFGGLKNLASRYNTIKELEDSKVYETKVHSAMKGAELSVKAEYMIP